MPASRKHDGKAYERRKQRQLEKDRAETRSGRDIGELPDVADPARRLACGQSFRAFCLTYFGATFNLPFSPDHDKAIAKIEACVLQGDRFALAMPRGSGKTSLCEIACLWGLLYGYRRFVVLIGASADAAAQNIASITTELESNELLAGDFPEVCYPIKQLEGIHQRRLLYKDQLVRIQLKSGRITMPDMPDSVSSGGILVACGITGRIRGLKHKHTDGSTVRPDLALLDDVQTDKAADSDAVCDKLEQVIKKAVLGLAGPKRKISAIMACTVVRHGDLAERFLDNGRHPEWHGERTKAMYSLPARMDLWDRYADLRRESMLAGGRGEQATEYYIANREDMDLGAKVAWPERFVADEVSATQNCMNVLLTNRHLFWSELQNDPLDEAIEAAELSPDQIANRLSNLPRGTAHADAVFVTSFIDVQADLLYYVVCAWSHDYTGTVIDYGAYPDQQRPYYLLREARPTLAAHTKMASLEASLRAGILNLVDMIASRRYAKEGGGELTLARGLIDANWGDSTPIVYQFCRSSHLASILRPSHGKGIGASSQPLTERKRKTGEVPGLNWYEDTAQQRGGGRRCFYDTNYWKSFTMSRLASEPGSPGSLTLFGSQPGTHRLIADHLHSEYRVPTEGRNRKVDEWRIRPEKPNNHLWDCLVGCTVGASMLGCKLAELPLSGRPQQQQGRKTFAERQREKLQQQQRRG